MIILTFNGLWSGLDSHSLDRIGLLFCVVIRRSWSLNNWWWNCYFSYFYTMHCKTVWLLYKLITLLEKEFLPLEECDNSLRSCNFISFYSLVSTHHIVYLHTCGVWKVSRAMFYMKSCKPGNLYFNACFSVTLVTFDHNGICVWLSWELPPFNFAWILSLWLPKPSSTNHCSTNFFLQLLIKSISE